jgi:Ca2+-binding RTX toxin-like protein
LVALTVIAASATGASAATWDIGDVFAGVGNSSVNVFGNAGTFKETITGGASSTFTTGCAFDSSDDLYATNFDAKEVVKYDGDDPHAVIATYPSQPSNGTPESVVFAENGDFYVGHAVGGIVEKHDSTGAFVQDYPTLQAGTDWIDLAADQRTIFFTDEGPEVFRYDLATQTPLSDFANTGNRNYALRLLPPGDGSGGLLVASTTDIKRLDGSGNIVQSYDAPGENNWFALNLDPNGTSFWSGNTPPSDNFYRFNIATGAIEVGPIASQAISGLFGLCLKGEPTAAVPPPQPPPEPPPSDYYEEACGLTINGVDLQGTDANETLSGTERKDRVRAAGGNDKVNGLDDKDCLFGNAGNDKVSGDDGADLIRAGSGNDKANGNDGNDNIKLQDGNDKAKGGPGDDRIKAQARGRDTVNCGSGDDHVIADHKDKVAKNCEHVSYSKHH